MQTCPDEVRPNKRILGPSTVGNSVSKIGVRNSTVGQKRPVAQKQSNGGIPDITDETPRKPERRVPRPAIRDRPQALAVLAGIYRRAESAIVAIIQRIIVISDDSQDVLAPFNSTRDL
jgi:hypothetical protein